MYRKSNDIHSAYVLVEVLSERAIGNLLFMATGGSSGQVWFIASSLSCQSSFSVLASSVTGGFTGQSSLTFFSAKVAGAKILALGLYSGDSMTASAQIEITQTTLIPGVRHLHVILDQQYDLFLHVCIYHSMSVTFRNLIIIIILCTVLNLI